MGPNLTYLCNRAVSGSSEAPSSESSRVMASAQLVSFAGAVL
jgi:hypothetical protein